MAKDMKLNFIVELREDDYWDLKNRQLLTQIIWTHYHTMEYLDRLNYPSQVTEEYIDTMSIYRITASYLVDDFVMDSVFLQWPDLLKPVRDYERVVLDK